MPIYCVVMNQAVVVSDLTLCSIATGYGDAPDAIQTCSAIVFFNSNTNKAGIYHYPASGIRSELHGRRKNSGLSRTQIDIQKRCRQMIRRMVQDVAPTHVLIFYGLSLGSPDGRVSNLPTDGFFHALRSYLRRKIPTTCALQLKPAVGGHVRVFLNGGRLSYDQDAPNLLVDLRTRGEGTYTTSDGNLSYHVYWSQD